MLGSLAYLFRRVSLPRRVGLVEGFERFRKTKWFPVVYVTLLAVIIGLVIPIAAGLASLVCLVVLGIGVAMFALPYLLGERSVKRLLVFGLYMTLVASLIAAGLYSSQLGSIPERKAEGSYGGFQLLNGTVSPYRQESGGTFTFSVVVKGNSSLSPGDLNVYVLVFDLGPWSIYRRYLPLEPVSGVNLSTGLTYSGSYAPEGAAYHYHRFEVFNQSVDLEPDLQCPYTQTATRYEDRPACFLAGAPLTEDFAGGSPGLVYGPVSASGLSLYTVSVAQRFVFMLFPLFTFFLILLMYWWTRRAREVRAKREDAMAEVRGTGDFECSNCGADVPGAATKCPKCGAVFDEEPAPEDKEDGSEPPAKVLPSPRGESKKRKAG